MTYKYIAVNCGNGYCGCDMEEMLIVETDTTETAINEMAYELAIENAETYAYVHFGWDEVPTEEDEEEYYANYVTYDWHEVSREQYEEYCEEYGIESIKEEN